MATLKYWTGSAWERVLGAGGTPSSRAFPAYGQPGSILSQGSVNHPDANGGGGGAYNVSDVAPPSHFECATQIWIVNSLYAGFSAGEAVSGGYMRSIRDGGGIAATGWGIGSHAGWWTPHFFVGTLDVASGGQYNGIRTELHQMTGNNFHTSGALSWIQVAT